MRLAALNGETATPKDICEAGANESWLVDWCDFCLSPANDVIDNGKTWDEGATICRQCAEAMTAMFQES